jgi:hypothetical protein
MNTNRGLYFARISKAIKKPEPPFDVMVPVPVKTVELIRMLPPLPPNTSIDRIREFWR